MDSVYAAFSQSAKPSTLYGCPCCTDDRMGQRLLSKPLRSLSAEDLDHYAFKAMSTWGDVAAFKYFLPRILELALAGKLLTDLEVVLRKLEYGEFAAWPASERSAIEHALLSAWVTAIRDGEVEFAGRLLCGAAAALDVGPFLTMADTISPTFRAAYRWGCGRADKPRLTSAYWDRDSANYRAVVAWAYAP